jgi:hypothetical protein
MASESQPSKTSTVLGAPYRTLWGILFLCVLASTRIFHFSILDDAHFVPKETSSSHQAPIARQCFRPRMGLSSIASDNHHPLPKPYLNLGFPKSGSSSLEQFFKCGRIRTSHWICKASAKNPRGYCGTCMKNAIRQRLPPLKTCGNYEAYTQLDVSIGKAHCYLPQIDALEEIHDEAPNATFILNFRNVSNWVRSMKNWGQFDKRLMACNSTGSPAWPLVERSSNSNDTSPWLTDFFCNQVERVRDFVAKHPSHALIEVDIEDPNAGEFLSEAFDIPASCWKQMNKSIKKNNTKTPRRRPRPRP